MRTSVLLIICVLLLAQNGCFKRNAEESPPVTASSSSVTQKPAVPEAGENNTVEQPPKPLDSILDSIDLEPPVDKRSESPAPGATSTYLADPLPEPVHGSDTSSENETDFGLTTDYDNTATSTTNNGLEPDYVVNEGVDFGNAFSFGNEPDEKIDQQVITDDTITLAEPGLTDFTKELSETSILKQDETSSFEPEQNEPEQDEQLHQAQTEPPIKLPTPALPTTKPAQPTSTLEIDTVDTCDYVNNGGKFFESVYINSHKNAGDAPIHAGFQCTNFDKEKSAGRDVNVETVLSAKRNNGALDINAVVQYCEDPNGDLIGAEANVRQGNVKLKHSALRVGDAINTKTVVNGSKTSIDNIPCNKNVPVGGHAAMQLALLKNPIKENEKRKMSFYDSVNQQLTDVVMTAGEIEPVDVLGKTMNLRRINAELLRNNSPMKDAEITISLWADKAGNIIKTESPFQGDDYFVTVRTTEGIAKEGMK
ncbi:MAG: hypothetical protein ACRC2T_04940 [Thermoguttaceae bacterium]